MSKYIKNSVFLAIFLMLTYGHLLLADDYKVAVRAHRGINTAINQWQPTIDILNQQLPQHTFTLNPILDLNQITQLAGEQKFDFVLTNPSSFVELELLYDVKALVTLNNKRADTAQSRFGSVIFTNVNNTDILTLHDLKNKTLIAVSEPAFGGWRVAWMEMLNQDFDPYTDLKELLFTQSKAQQDVVYAVRNGKVDAGVVRTDLLERMEAAGKVDMRYLRILNNKDIRDFPFFLSTKLYPEWAFAALKHVPAIHTREITKILLSISKDSQAALSGSYIGWIPPSDYNEVKNLMAKLKVGPYAR